MRMEGVVDFLFYLGSGLVVAAGVLSNTLLRQLSEDVPMVAELFALPNAWLGPRPSWTSASVPVLRAKYFLPWVAAPARMAEQPWAVRATFWSARLTGAASPVAMIAFFGSAVVQSGQ